MLAANQSLWTRMRDFWVDRETDVDWTCQMLQGLMQQLPILRDQKKTIRLWVELSIHLYATDFFGKFVGLPWLVKIAV